MIDYFITARRLRRLLTKKCPIVRARPSLIAGVGSEIKERQMLIYINIHRAITNWR